MESLPWGGLDCAKFLDLHFRLLLLLELTGLEPQNIDLLKRFPAIFYWSWGSGQVATMWHCLTGSGLSANDKPQATKGCESSDRDPVITLELEIMPLNTMAIGTGEAAYLHGIGSLGGPQ